MRDHNNVMVKVMTGVEIKAMHIIVMFQGYVIVKFFLFSNEGSLVTANHLTEKANPVLDESVIPDTIRIRILTKALYNKNTYKNYN